MAIPDRRNLAVDKTGSFHCRTDTTALFRPVKNDVHDNDLVGVYEIKSVAVVSNAGMEEACHGDGTLTELSVVCPS